MPYRTISRLVAVALIALAAANAFAARRTLGPQPIANASSDSVMVRSDEPVTQVAPDETAPKLSPAEVAAMVEAAQHPQASVLVNPAPVMDATVTSLTALPPVGLTKAPILAPAPVLAQAQSTETITVLPAVAPQKPSAINPAAPGLVTPSKPVAQPAAVAPEQATPMPAPGIPPALSTTAPAPVAVAPKEAAVAPTPAAVVATTAPLAAVPDKTPGKPEAEQVVTLHSTLIGTTPPPATAETDSTAEKKDPAVVLTAYQEEVLRLEGMGKVSIPMRGIPLHLAIRAIANSARMNYIAPDEEDFAEKVTLRFEGTPWQLLSVLKHRHNFEASFEDGLWTFYRPQAGELITRTYEIVHNSLVSVKSSGNSSASNDTSSSSGSSGSGSNSSYTSGGSGSSSQNSSATSTGTTIFTVDSKKIVDEIKTLLGIPITGVEAQIASGGAAGELGALPEKSKDSGKTIGTPHAQVLFLNDSNQLFVVATRQQHQYVEEYLKAADRPQPLIRIDAQLVETSRDPRSFLGVDPSGIARPTFSLQDAASATSSTSTSTSTTGSTGSTTSPGITTPTFDLGHLKSVRWPNAVVLNATDLSFQLNLLKQDATSRLVSQPRLVTTNNREVCIESVIQEPYASSQTNNAFSGTSGSTGQTTTQLERIKIGTTINVLPRIIRGSSKDGRRLVNLNLVMTVSGKVGDKNIFGQLVPITSSRSYLYEIVVPDGYTLAIGGLDETTISSSVNKVPLAGDIPLVGYLFKNENKETNTRNLIAYLTPKIIDLDSNGLPVDGVDQQERPVLPIAPMVGMKTASAKK